MAVTIGANIGSLKGQRALAQATSRVSDTAERLASGQRINKASDDAAGLSVADRLKNETRLYNAARRNLNDGLSAIAITNDALDSQIGIYTRLSELAEQAANGTLSSKQRSTLNQEFQALIKEAGRIGDTTSFNGTSLLTMGRRAQLSELLIQAGINGSAAARLGIAGGDTGSLSGTFDTSKIATALEFLDLDGDGSVGVSDQDALTTGSLTTERLKEIFKGNVMIIDTTRADGRASQVLVGMVTDFANGTGSALVTFINTQTDPNGAGAWIASSETSDSYYGYLGDGPASTDQQIEIDASGRVTNRNEITIPANSYLGSNVNINLTGILFKSSTQAGAGGDLLETLRLSTMSEARDALDTLQRRIANTSALRGSLGAFESRIESALRLTTVFGETSAAAESRIRSADIASESAEYTRSTILQQVSASVLAQANLQPQLALQLLR